jgi:hypothetical protein
MRHIFVLLSAIVALFGNVHAHDQQFKPYFVGALHKKWKFPSDHLPIGAKVKDFRLASWNVLNEKYLSFIVEDGQGLNGSLITQLAKVQSAHGLSKREQVIFRQCTTMMKNRALIGLVETSNSLLHYLRHHSPLGWKCLFPSSPTHQEDIFLYNTKRLKILHSTVVQYSDDSPKVVFLLKVKEKKSGKVYSIILTHVPGGGPQGLAQMASIVKGLFDPALETVVMGDMNASPYTVLQALQNEGLLFSVAASTYPTHINTAKKACWFDAFFVYSPKDHKFLNPDTANQIFGKKYTHVHSKKLEVFGVQDAAHLLQKEHKLH